MQVKRKVISKKLIQKNNSQKINPISPEKESRGDS